MINRVRIILFLILIGTAFVSCKKKLEDSPSWEAVILAPLLQSSLTIDDLIADSLIEVNADNSLSLVYSNPVYHFSFAEEGLQIPDTIIKKDLSLNTLELGDQSVVYPFSLGQMCQQLGVIGQFIIAANGTTATILPIADFSTGDNPIDATQLFETATLEQGFIDVTITDSLPIPIGNLVFQIRNALNQEVLAQDTFINILPGTSQSKTIDVSGKTVEGTMLAKIIDLDSPGGNNVLIDTSDAIILEMLAHDMVVSSATAIFPEQDLINQQEEVRFFADGGAELNLMTVKSGTLIVTVQSTIGEQSHFAFAFPSATDVYGNSIQLAADLPPAPEFGVSQYSKSFDLAGYSLDLTGIDGTKHNTYYSELVATTTYTGNVVTISNTDSVFVLYQLLDVVPAYAEGYMGQQIFNIGPESSAFSIFNHVKRGSLLLEDVSVDLSIHNGVGVQGRINLYNLTSVNSRTGNQVTLQWNQLGAPLSIAAATDNPLTTALTEFQLNGSNSNIKSLVENLPDQFSYALDLFINPYGNSSNYNDFVYDYSELEVNLDLRIPLSLVANDLTLIDTLDFTLGSAEPGDAVIRDGVFTLIADNGFPLSTNIQLYFYDESFSFIDSLFEGANLVAAGLLNDQCLVEASQRSVLNIAIPEDRMTNLRRATKAIISASFNTASSSYCNSYISIYDQYQLNTKLTGKFTYYTGY